MKDIIIVVAWLFCIISSFIMGSIVMERIYKEKLIKRGLAEYTIDKTTGDSGFTFIVRGK